MGPQEVTLHLPGFSMVPGANAQTTLVDGCNTLRCRWGAGLPVAAAASQGCRPLSDAIYTVEAVADGGGPVVVTLRDERGRKVTPLEALQRELQKVWARPGHTFKRLRFIQGWMLTKSLRVHRSY